MNAAARSLAGSNWIGDSIFFTTLTKRGLLLLILVCSVLFSAFSVVYVKNLNRRLFSDLQTLQFEKEHLKVEWGQLMLEQSTWATPGRILQIAQENLQMVTPSPDNTVIYPKDFKLRRGAHEGEQRSV